MAADNVCCLSKNRLYTRPPKQAALCQLRTISATNLNIGYADLATQVW